MNYHMVDSRKAEFIVMLHLPVFSIRKEAFSGVSSSAIMMDFSHSSASDTGFSIYALIFDHSIDISDLTRFLISRHTRSNLALSQSLCDPNISGEHTVLHQTGKY